MEWWNKERSGVSLNERIAWKSLIRLRIDMFGGTYFRRDCIGGYSKRIQQFWALSYATFFSVYRTLLTLTVLFLTLNNIINFAYYLNNRAQ